MDGKVCLPMVQKCLSRGVLAIIRHPSATIVDTWVSKVLLLVLLSSKILQDCFVLFHELQVLILSTFSYFTLHDIVSANTIFRWFYFVSLRTENRATMFNLWIERRKWSDWSRSTFNDCLGEGIMRRSDTSTVSELAEGVANVWYVNTMRRIFTLCITEKSKLTF